MQQHSGKDTAATRKEELAEYKKTNGEVEVGSSGHHVTIYERCGPSHNVVNSEYVSFLLVCWHAAQGCQRGHCQST